MFSASLPTRALPLFASVESNTEWMWCVDHWWVGRCGAVAREGGVVKSIAHLFRFTRGCPRPLLVLLLQSGFLLLWRTGQYGVNRAAPSNIAAAQRKSPTPLGLPFLCLHQTPNRSSFHRIDSMRLISTEMDRVPRGVFDDGRGGSVRARLPLSRPCTGTHPSSLPEFICKPSHKIQSARGRDKIK